MAPSSRRAPSTALRLVARIALAAGLLAVTMGHGGGGGCGGEDPLFGPPTGSTCPPDSTLTYETFGRPFMESYCTRCHASTLTGAARQGAPSFHDFDSVFGIRAVSDHVDETTASGPDATNDSMPPDGAKPTLEERRRLGEWIACGMPTDADLAGARR